MSGLFTEDLTFEVNVVFNPVMDMVITANQVEGNESFVIEIEREKVDPLMEVFEGQFDHLIDHLKLINDRMVLVNPRFAAK